MAWRHGRVEKAGDWQGGNREVSVMQQGRDLTDLCWHFLFINRTVTDELHNKIPADCRGCRNDPFWGGKKAQTKEGGHESIFLNFSSEKCLQYILMEEKALHHSVLHWFTMTRSEGDQCRKSHSAFQSPREFLYVPFSVQGQTGKGGGLRGEHSLISNKLQGPQLASTSCIMMGFKLGSSFGISLLMISSSSYSQGHL